jgi:hypothetical protein
MIMEETIISLVNNVGFPITVALYFMFKTEKVIKANTEALFQIKQIVGKCTNK